MNISKRYGDLVLFDDVSLRMDEGKKYYICGANENGKSVLLKIIVGYAKPTAGKVIVDGEQLGVKNDFIADDGVSINSPEFVSHYTGMENLKEIARIKKIVSTAQIMELAKILEIEQSLNKKVSKYSLGMKQKLRLIQAIMEKPRYIILDEPFDALDNRMKDIAKGLLDEAVREGATLIFTSHEPDARTYADVALQIENRQLELL